MSDVRLRAGGLTVLLVVSACAACAAAKPAARSIPPGRGWVCGTEPNRSRFCVRTVEECEVGPVACARTVLAHCFTWVGRDGEPHWSCKPTASECALQAARFARDEREVSTCEASF